MSIADKARPRTDPRITGQTLDKLPKRLRQLYDILCAKGIDLADLDDATVRKVGFWQAMHKDDDGNAVITDLARIELAPAWDDGPAWPVVQPGPRPKVPAKAKAKAAAKGWRTAVILPDIQAGYYRTPDGDLEPIRCRGVPRRVPRTVRVAAADRLPCDEDAPGPKRAGGFFAFRACTPRVRRPVRPWRRRRRAHATPRPGSPSPHRSRGAVGRRRTRRPSPPERAALRRPGTGHR